MQRTGHVDGIGEEISGICDQDDEATLNLWEPPDKSVLEQQAGSYTNDQTNDQTAKEDEQEDTDTLEQTQYGQMTSGSAGFVFLGRLEEDNGNGVVQDGFAKDDGVKLGVYSVRVEYSEDGDGVGGGQSGADRHGLDKGDVQAFERYTSPEPQDDAEDHGGDEGASKGKGQDCANVAEEVALMQFVTGIKDDGRQKKIEEELIVETDGAQDGLSSGQA